MVKQRSRKSVRAQPKTKKKTVDALGRVDGKTFPDVVSPTAEEIKIYGTPGIPSDDSFGVDRRIVESYERAWGKREEEIGKDEPIRIQPPDNDTGSAIMNPANKDNISEKGLRSVQVFKDHELIYPALCFRIYVEPDPAAANDLALYARLFSRSCCSRADRPEEADLVVFSGGSDVNPKLYGQSAHMSTWFNEERDKRDKALFDLCVKEGIPMVGVCRGAQFLHVMNGGQLYQDVDGHNSPHAIYDVKNNKTINRISSVHHQMVMDNTEGGMEIIAVARGVSECRALSATMMETGNNDDIEAFYYRETGCLGVQGHPEYGGFNAFSIWFLEKIDEYISLNADFEWSKKSGRYRMQEGLKEEKLLLTVNPDNGSKKKG